MEILLSVLIPILAVVVFFGLLFLLSLKSLVYTCAPNEALIFSGRRRRVGDKIVSYDIIKGGRRVKWPLIERVDRMDLSNMTIDISATNAYSKGGIPLTVQGVANVKVAGHEPLMNNAIERFLGRNRGEIMQIAKATLEGSLRGVLATMTPEQVNEDKLLFAERLVQEVEQDMTALGLTVDTMKIQNVQDDVKYLDSIGRARNADVVSHARIAEANARADSIVRSAENELKEAEAQISAQTEIAKADAQRRLTDALTRRAALVAEEQAQVIALVAQSKAELDVQKARLEQTKGKLDADVVQPAIAAAEAAEAQARAVTATIIEEGRARADALRQLSVTWQQAGPNARDILLSQKLDSVIRAIVDVIPETDVERVTMIDGGGSGKFPMNTIGTLETVKQVFGIDVVEKLKGMGENKPEVNALPQSQAAPLSEQMPEQREPVEIPVRMQAKPPVVKKFEV